MEFYACSSTALTANDVVVTNNGDYTEITNTQPANITVESFTNTPSGAITGQGDYYRIRVPLIKETVTPSIGGVAQEPTVNYLPVEMTVKGVAVTSGDISDLNVQYPCLFITSQELKDMISVTYTYQWGAEKIFWIHAETANDTVNGGIKVPTVTYKSPYSGSGLSDGTATLVESWNNSTNQGVKYFFGYKAPATVTRTSSLGESETQMTELDISATLKSGATGGTASNVALASGILDEEPCCYFLQYDSNSLSGWYPLVTILFDDGGTKKAKDYPLVHSWYKVNGNSIPVPTSTNVWGNNTMVATNCNDNLYCYMPYDSRFQFLMVNSSEQKLINDDIQLKSYDYLYYYATGRVTSSINSSFYPYTATAKTTSLLNASPLTRSVVIPPSDPDNSDPDNSDPDNSDPDAGDSGNRSGGSDNGQFKATGTQVPENSGFYLANGVNFKLFNSSEDDLSEQTPVVRQTMDNGGFYLLDNQTARFTFQFPVASGLKIAQTGDNMLFNQTSGKVDGAVINTVNPGANTPSTENGSATTTNSDGFTRYSSTWSMKDGKDAEITSNRDTYNTYLYPGSYTPTGSSVSAIEGSSLKNQGAMPFDYFKTAAGTNEDVVVTVTYEQTVLTGDLIVKKVLNTSALNSIEDYISKDHASYNPEFAFRLYFSDVFGGGSNEREYISSVTSNAVYYLTDGTNYLTTDGTSTTSDLSEAIRMINSTDGAKLTYEQIDAGYYIVVKDIPVDTNYSVEEVLPTPAANSDEPEFQLKSMVAFQTGNSSGSNSTQAAFDSDLKTTTDLELKAYVDYGDDDDPGDKVSENNGVLADYYKAATGAANYLLEATNEATMGYIIIAKKIDHYYYNTNDDYVDSDDPAAIFGKNFRVGGAQASDDDANGYQAATNAEQTFIFRIDEYAPNGSGGYAESPQSTIYETLSFSSGDALDTYKYRVLAADTSCKYVITEITDWSWKYSPSDLVITPSAGNTPNGYSGATIVAFGDNTIPTVDGNGSPVSGGGNKTYKNSAMAKFTNEKIESRVRDVEGDTSIVENEATRAA